MPIKDKNGFMEFIIKIFVLALFFVCLDFFVGGKGRKSYTQKLSVSLPSIYLAEVHGGNYDNFASQ